MKSDLILSSLGVIHSLLEHSCMEYWLGRGVLRHWRLYGEVGEGQSDLDFHIWMEDKERLSNILKNHFEYSQNSIKDYKCVFFDKINGCQIEFMFLSKSNEYKDLVYHERKNGRYYFPASCVVSYDTMSIADADVRVPKNLEAYFIGLYGSEWEREIKEDKENHEFINNPTGLREYLLSQGLMS